MQAVRLRPYDAATYLRLATALYGLRREQEAVEVYEKWLEIEPDSCEAQHMVAAASGRNVPARASDAYVQRTFDQYADSFDQSLPVAGIPGTAAASRPGSPGCRTRRYGILLRRNRR